MTFFLPVVFWLACRILFGRPLRIRRSLPTIWSLCVVLFLTSISFLFAYHRFQGYFFVLIDVAVLARVSCILCLSERTYVCFYRFRGKSIGE